MLQLLELKISLYNSGRIKQSYKQNHRLRPREKKERDRLCVGWTPVGTPGFKGTRDNFKIHVNFMKLTFLCSLRQDETYDEA